MRKKGHLAKLVGEHVIAERSTIESDINELSSGLKKTTEIQLSPKNLSLEDAGLTVQQIENRRRVSNALHINDTNIDIASGIERNQLRVSINPILKKKFDLITRELDAEEPVPEDADPMKLVLEDQSIFYKKNPLKAYIQSGSGSIVSILIVVLFFFVHGIRIGSGR